MARAIKTRTAKTTLGSRLRQLRELTGLSLRSVATAAKISAPYLSQLERDRGTPSDQVVFDLSDALSCDPDELFAILGRPAEDVKTIMLRHPAEWAGVVLAGKDFSAKDVAALKVYAEKLRTKLGLPEE